MTFHGASKGCSPCRLRKIKCDEKRPKCQKCVKAGRPCLGYRTEADIMFRNMNHTAEQKVKTRIKQRDQSDENNQKRVLNPTFNNSIALSRREQWSNIAVNRFFNDYIQESLGETDSMRFLLESYNDPNASSILKESLYVVAFASLANQENIKWLGMEAIRSYGHLLSIVPKAMIHPLKIGQPSTITTIYLLGLYEVVSGYMPFDTLFGDHHHPGLVPLLQCDNTISSVPDIRDYCYEITKCIIKHQKPPEGILNRLEKSSESWHLATAFFCAKAQRIFDSTIRDITWHAELLQLVQDATNIDTDFELWGNSRTGVWNIKESYMRSTDNEVNSVTFYYDIWTCFFWNLYRSCRLHLHEVLLQCVSLILSYEPIQKSSLDTEAILLRSKTIISEMLVGICKSIPYSLGDIDSEGNPTPLMKKKPVYGYIMVATLHIAMASAQIGGGTERLIRETLEFIANNLGIRTALLISRRQKREPWDLS